MELGEIKALMSGIDPVVMDRIKREAWSMALSIKYGNESLAPLFQSKPKALSIPPVDRRVLAEMAGRISGQLMLKHFDENAYWAHVKMKSGGADGECWPLLVDHGDADKV